MMQFPGRFLSCHLGPHVLSGNQGPVYSASFLLYSWSLACVTLLWTRRFNSFFTLYLFGMPTAIYCCARLESKYKEAGLGGRAGQYINIIYVYVLCSNWESPLPPFLPFLLTSYLSSTPFPLKESLNRKMQ